MTNQYQRNPMGLYLPAQSTRLPKPVLKFTPYAWAKLLFLRDCDDTEVGGFGIAPLHNQLLVQDIQLIKQYVTAASVEFDKEAIANQLEDNFALGLQPVQFARIWIHTHPAISPTPSWTDEDTFKKAFSRADWSVMFILAKGGETYSRIQYRSGPLAAVEMEVEIDFSQDSPAVNTTVRNAWEDEYMLNVFSNDWFEIQDQNSMQDYGGDNQIFDDSYIDEEGRIRREGYDDMTRQEIMRASAELQDEAEQATARALERSS